MNREITAYIELDSLFDYRRGIIQWGITEGITDLNKRKIEGDRLWENYIAKNYKNRRLDTFSYPEFKFDRDKFDKLYKERNLTNFIMYYPTNLRRGLLKRIVDLENIIDKPIEIRSVTLTVNTFPYLLDDELLGDLREQLVKSLKGLVNIRFVHKDDSKLDATFYRRFNYVFKYNVLTGESSKKLMESLAEVQIPETVFIVPDILNKEVEELEGEPADRIFALSICVGTTITIIPISKNFYDYEG